MHGPRRRPVHLVDQRLRAVEPFLGAQEAREHDFHAAAIEIAGEVEQMHLEEWCAIVEGRTPAEACHPVVHLSVDPHPYRVDPVREGGFRGKGKVGGGVAQFAAALVAMRDLGGEEPAVAQQRIGERDVPLGQGGADAAGRDRLAAFVGFRGHDGHAEAVRRACLDKKLGRAAPRATEVKVIAGDRMHDPHALAQDVLHEGFRLNGRERTGERGCDDAVKSAGGHDPCPFLRWRQTEHGPVGRENRSRMGIEGQDEGWNLASMRNGKRRVENGPVTSVHAIEIADCDHAAAQVVGKLRKIGDRGEAEGRLMCHGRGRTG